MPTKLTNFDQALDYLYNQTPNSRDTSVPAKLGLARTKYFLSLLGNPQERLKIIHLAGTSGKGSTAYLTSLLLKTCGFKVGLELSPHVLDIRERLQVNNQMLSPEKFTAYLSDLLPFIEQVKNSEYGPATYFEILTILAYYTFYKEGMDYAVTETGMGGLYDATNTVKNHNKLALITRIGIDHRRVLGNTIKEISVNKAGIIQEGNQVLSVYQAPSARKNLESRSLEKQAELTYIKKNENYKNIEVDELFTQFDFSFDGVKLDSLFLSLLGFYQAENCSLALAALITLSKRDKFKIDWDKIRDVLKQSRFTGRLDIINFQGKELIIDGAHNPQKMSNFLKALTSIYPNQKFTFLLAFKKGKDYNNMLKLICPFSDQLILTNFFSANNNLSHLSAKPDKLKKVVEKAGFNNFSIAKNPEEGFKIVLNSKNPKVVITGSLYFLSEIYPLLGKPVM